ncbi:MAG: hypothetical protein AAF416_20440 [Pseudomonadota bacterium]
MKPVVAGTIAAVAIIAAFVAGSFIEIESDGDISLAVEEESKLEQAAEEVGEAVDAVQN